jgi:DNA-binding MarR family transcriptional regulator
MMAKRIAVHEVLEYLGVDDTDLLDRLREEGLFEDDQLEAHTVEELRVATCLVRELGVNAAGVGVVLHLRRRLLVLQGRMSDTVKRLLDEQEDR